MEMEGNTQCFAIIITDTIHLLCSWFVFEELNVILIWGTSLLYSGIYTFSYSSPATSDTELSCHETGHLPQTETDAVCWLQSWQSYGMFLFIECGANLLPKWFSNSFIEIVKTTLILAC